MDVFTKLEPYQKRDWLAGRVTAKQALLRFIEDKKEFNKISVSNYTSGQPYILGYPKISCSISHCNFWAVAAVSNSFVGVDIEKIRQIRPELLLYISDKAEQRQLERVGHVELAAIRLWTVKEAVMKAIGLGFAISPKSILITKATSKTCEVDILSSQYRGPHHWEVSSLIKDHYMISVAYEKEQNPPNIHWYKPPRISITATKAHS